MSTQTRKSDTIEEQFVAHEHQEIVQGLDRLLKVAAETDRLAVPDLVHELNAVLHWLEQSLEPHTAWEERWLHPRLDDDAANHLATSMLAFQHRQIRQRIEALRTRRDAIVAEGSHVRPRDIAPRLYGLEAVIRMHLEGEDRVVTTSWRAEATRLSKLADPGERGTGACRASLPPSGSIG